MNSCGFTLTLQTCYRPKPLNSRQSTPSEPLLASGRTSRTVKYASTYPRLREATSSAPWRVFPRYRSATLGFTLIELLIVIAIVLVLISTLFFTPFASARTAINASSAPVKKFTREIRLAEGKSKTDEARSQAIRQYFADIFGVQGSKTSWYDNIIDVEVMGDTATVKTNLSSGDEKTISVCGVVSGFIYSHLNVQLGIRKVKILGSSGEVIVFRRSVLDDCPYKSSRNPGLQPPAPQLR